MTRFPLPRVRSLRTRLLIQILPVVALAVIAMTAVAVKVASTSQREAVYGHQTELIKRQAARFDGEVRRAQALSHSLVDAVEADTEHDRARGAAVIKRIAVRNPDLLGTWAAFEPDAFDANDAAHVNDGVRGDSDGRFAFWAERLTGKLNLTAFENEPGKPWSKDEYYTLPVEKGFDGMLEPYLDSGTMMTTYVTPIERGGKRVGAVGIDLALRDLDAQRQAREGARLGLRVRGLQQRPAGRLPRSEGLDGQADAQADRRPPSRRRPGGHLRRHEGGSRGPHRDDRPGDGQGRRAVLRPGRDRRLELRRGRAHGRAARGCQAPAHDPDRARPARPAARGAPCSS